MMRCPIKELDPSALGKNRQVIGIFLKHLMTNWNFKTLTILKAPIFLFQHLILVGKLLNTATGRGMVQLERAGPVFETPKPSPNGLWILGLWPKPRWYYHYIRYPRVEPGPHSIRAFKSRRKLKCDPENFHALMGLFHVIEFIGIVKLFISKDCYNKESKVNIQIRPSNNLSVGWQLNEGKMRNEFPTIALVIQIRAKSSPIYPTILYPSLHRLFKNHSRSIWPRIIMYSLQTKGP